MCSRLNLLFENARVLCILAVLSSVFVAVKSLDCQPLPFPIGVDQNVVQFDARNGSNAFYNGDLAQQARDIHIFCTTGCSNTFTQVSVFKCNRKLLEAIRLNSLDLLIHGYTDKMQAADKGWINKTATTLACRTQSTVCAVDWNHLATFRYDVTVLRNVGVVANYLSEFVIRLQRLGLRLENLRCIGHSLGAHLCGYIGKNFGPRTIGEIIGLDPAGPFYPLEPAIGRLNNTDAKKTVCIHTNPNGTLGIGFDVCDGNFWPNQLDGPVNPNPHQPACGDDDGCSHAIAVYYFYASLFSDFVGTLICNTPKCVHRTEIFGVKYSGLVGDFNSTTTSCFPFINNQ